MYIKLVSLILSISSLNIGCKKFSYNVRHTRKKNPLFSTSYAGDSALLKVS